MASEEAIPESSGEGVEQGHRERRRGREER